MNNGFSDACKTSTAAEEYFRVAGENRFIFSEFRKKFTRPESNRRLFRFTNLPHICPFSPLLHSNTRIGVQANSTSRALNSDFANVNRFYVEPLSIFHCDVRTIKLEMPTQTSSNGFVRSWTWKMYMSFEHWKLHEIKGWHPLPMPCARFWTTRMSIRCAAKIVNHFQLLHCNCDTACSCDPHLMHIMYIMNSTTNHLNIESHVSRATTAKKKCFFFLCTWRTAQFVGNGGISSSRAFFHFCRHSIQ